MKAITTEQYFRFLVQKKINKYVKKCKCNICGSTKNLEIHHDEGFEFSKILTESLSLLNLNFNKYSNQYTKDELKLISLLVLGNHLYFHFSIICESCHIEQHKKYNLRSYKTLMIKYPNQINLYKNYFPKATLDDIIENFNKFYLEKILIEKYKDKIIWHDKIKEFQEDIKSNIMTYFLKMRIEHYGKKVINDLFQFHNLNYRIFSKQNRKRGIDRDKVYWIIEEITND